MPSYTDEKSWAILAADLSKWFGLLRTEDITPPEKYRLESIRSRWIAKGLISREDAAYCRSVQRSVAGRAENALHERAPRTRQSNRRAKPIETVVLHEITALVSKPKKEWPKIIEPKPYVFSVPLDIKIFVD